MTLGERIKSRRIQLDMTQDELAKKTGFTSRSSINKIELDKCSINQSKVLVFAEALQTTPQYILGCEDEEQKEDAPITERDRSINAIMNIFSKLSPEEKLDIICYASEMLNKREEH